MLGFSGTYKGNAVSGDGPRHGDPVGVDLLHRADQGLTASNESSASAAAAPSTRHVELRDVVIAMGASTDSGVNRMRFGGYDLAAIASFDLLRNAVRVAEKRELRFHVGNVFSADLFYAADPTQLDLMKKNNILGVEMETAGIYAIAAELGAEALGDLHRERRHQERRGAVTGRAPDDLRRDDRARPRGGAGGDLDSRSRHEQFVAGEAGVAG